jgi:solute carrier family 25 carnitine/acylcarnitine transporter 20/29
MTFPLATVPIVNAVVFAFHELTKKMLNIHDDNHMNLWDGIIAGSVAGFANCAVVTPVELVKCRLQVQYEDKAKAYYKGVVDCLWKICKEEGIRNLYRGNAITILREVPAYAAQFGGYYYAKKFLAKFRNKKLNELSNVDVMAAGSIGGYMCWQFSYPQDVLKTHLQLAKNNHYKTLLYDGGIIDCFKYVYKKDGFYGFWKGYLPCTLRAIVANGVLFLTYENAKSYLQGSKKRWNFP